MGALANNRKRGDDYYKSLVSSSSPIDQSCIHIAKKPSFSVSPAQTRPEYCRPQSSNTISLEKKEEKITKEVAKEWFVPLTEEEQSEVNYALSNSNRRKVLVTHENSNIDINGEKLQCLQPGAWLNDEVINLYLELLKERETREPKKFLK